MNPTSCTLTIRPEGSLIAIYTEALDLVSLGDIHIRRVSHVEPDERGQWWADLSPIHGPILGPYPHRSQALKAEQQYLSSRIEHAPDFDHPRNSNLQHNPRNPTPKLQTTSSNSARPTDIPTISAFNSASSSCNII